MRFLCIGKLNTQSLQFFITWNVCSTLESTTRTTIHIYIAVHVALGEKEVQMHASRELQEMITPKRDPKHT